MGFDSGFDSRFDSGVWRFQWVLIVDSMGLNECFGGF